MTIIEIKDRESLRVGDIATFAYDGHEFTGPLWTEGGGTLFIGDAHVRYSTGDFFGNFEFVRATREAPPLPTEPGAVILVTECRGERVDEPVLVVLDGEGDWRTFGRTFGGCMWHLPRHITEWTPAKVVPA